MGLIADFFRTFSEAGAKTTTGIQSIAQRGYIQPRVTPPTRQVSTYIATTARQIQRTPGKQFATREVMKINNYITQSIQKTRFKIPTLYDIQMAGYRYGKSNPAAARLIYGSGNFGASVVRNAIPTNIGISTSKAMVAFSDGTIKGAKNLSVLSLGKAYEKINLRLSTEIKKITPEKLPAEIGVMVGDPLGLRSKKIPITVPFWGKGGRETLPQIKATSAHLAGMYDEFRNKPLLAAVYASLPYAVRKGMKVVGTVPVIKSIVNSPNIMKIASASIGVVYTKSLFDYVNSPSETGRYTEELTSETSKVLPNGDTEITEIYTQTPIMGPPSYQEKAYRWGGILSTQLGPMALGEFGIRQFSKVKLKKIDTKPVKQTIKKVIVNGKVKSKKIISKKTQLEKDILKARVKKVKSITKKAERKFKVKKAIRKIEPIKRSVKQIQNKISGIKSRYNNILKQKLPSRTVRLYNKIRAKEMELLFEINPTKRIKIQNELNSLINKITKEVGRKTIIKRIIDQNRRFLKDESAITNLIQTGKKTTILEYTPKSEVMAFERSLKPITAARKLYVKEYETIFETGKVLPSIKDLQVIASEPLPKISTFKDLNYISDLPTGEIKIPSLNKQLNVRANMPQSLKTQIKSIKSNVTKFNKTTKELNANISKLKKLKKSLRTIKTRTGKIKLIKKIKAINIIIINLTKNRNKLSIIIINKINSYRSSKTYRDYRNLIKPIIKIKSVAKPKTKIQVKTIVKPVTKVVTKPRLKTKPKIIPKPKPKIIIKPIIIPPTLALPKKLKSKKKKKIKGKKPRAFIVKNPIPTFEDIYG